MNRTCCTDLKYPGKLLLAGLFAALGLGLGVVPAQAAADPTQPEATAPVYPSATPDDDSADEGTVLIPSVTSQEGNFYLAVTDAALDEVDSERIMDQVRQAVGEQDAKILLGVDQEPNNLKGAGQLVRGMLMFGDSDALSDDWLENGKTLGYVGEGWIAIGVMLPQEAGDPVEIAVDPGRDVRETAPGSQQRILEAGQGEFAAGDYTAGITAVALATTQQLQAPPDRTLAKVIAVGALAATLAFLLAWAWRAKRRKARQAAAADRNKQAELLESRIQRASIYLNRHPVPDPGLAGESRLAQVMAELERQRAGSQQGALRALDTAPDSLQSQQVSEKQLADLRRRERELSLLRGAVQLAHDFAGRPRDSRESWNRTFAYHRARLEDLALFLDLPGAGQLACAQAARTVIITHTDELQLLHTRLSCRSTGADTAPGILDRLWELRDELDGVLHDGLAQARQARLKIPHGLGESMEGAQRKTDPLEDDPITVLRNFAPGSGTR
ncbi:hypothetical protein CQ012_09590 [Arthrobacter sp. MYb214]|uniref:hypothetical protein n=1 Tax=unclassified Arthrobacter TaxID=235627 RepID=UPI000CFCB241|nr:MULTISPECIES: hypothetical protein [unclassified Arthrobacter]PQZ90512.1 hypothetical protein CQ016_00910 [Arthrobacter sp. MYb222]PRB75909.1 hypothetical protein CQ012_09590 [Arthrobacter sp. MYb214]